MQGIRCGQPSRKLATASGFTEMQIKCPRCRALNQLKAESLLQPPNRLGFLRFLCRLCKMTEVIYLTLAPQIFARRVSVKNRLRMLIYRS